MRARVDSLTILEDHLTPLAHIFVAPDWAESMDGEIPLQMDEAMLVQARDDVGDVAMAVLLLPRYAKDCW